MKVNKIGLKPCIPSPLEVLQVCAKVADQYDVYHAGIPDSEINAFLFARCMKESHGKMPMAHIIKCLPTIIALIKDNPGYYGLCSAEEPPAESNV